MSALLEAPVSLAVGLSEFIKFVSVLSFTALAALATLAASDFSELSIIVAGIGTEVSVEVGKELPFWSACPDLCFAVFSLRIFPGFINSTSSVLTCIFPINLSPIVVLIASAFD
ncbi:MAG: hypothetical protein IKN30_02000 [Synergistaceae bacterium]|nr:hypothetical protein [Synergistaceae bacterium]